mgnify:CR=1 FL=1
MRVSPATSPDSRNKKRYYLYETPFRRLAVVVLKAIFWVLVAKKVNGLENLPVAGPVVLAANHISEFDMFPMQFSILRPIFFMGKAELFRNPLLDALFRQLGAFPIERGVRDDWAMHHALEILKQGQVLGIYPEGTRTRGHGLQAAKTGAARLAIAASCPLVPMAVAGTQRIFRGSLIRTPVTVTIGEPLHARPGESPLDLTDRLMFTLADMLPEELRGVYAERPRGFQV